jgi:Ca2+-binding EF-hand superfamily protein
VFDKEGKGVVSTNEMRSVLTTMGEKLSEEEVCSRITQQEKNDIQ